MNKGGVAQGNSKNGVATNPNNTDPYVTIEQTTPLTINGIIKIGFITNGNPKTTGSTIEKNAAGKEAMENAFKCFTFENKRITNNPNTGPVHRHVLSTAVDQM